uniref:Uncharacterized protein n=1 Tax=virus sp. ctkyY8 TaxID=2827995 RepID=A0A8S5REV3_9VIRU|nr:MAG TPA: hypothetical protein [virus sp. ctkyY8]
METTIIVLSFCFHHQISFANGSSPYCFAIFIATMNSFVSRSGKLADRKALI